MAGEFAANWTPAKLGDVADVLWGDTSTTKASYTASGFAAYSASGRDGFLPYADFDRTGVVVSAIGAECGKTWLAKGKWSCIKNTIRFWSKVPDVDTEFLYWLTSNPNDWPKRGSAQPFISQGDARAMDIAYPPLAEQKAIAAVLGALDDKIECHRRMNATLEAMARALFQSWFIDFDPVRRNADRDQNQPSTRPYGHPSPSGRRAGEEGAAGLGSRAGDEGLVAYDKLFPDSFQDSELGHIPKEWEVKTADEISTVGIGKTPPRKEHHWFSENPADVPWMSIRDLGEAGVFISKTSEFLTPEAVEKFRVRRIPDNTVVLSFKLTMGRVAITDGEMLSNEAIAHFRLNPETPFGSAYLYCYLKGFGYDQLGSTSSIATAINSDMVRGIKVLVPSKGVAEAFEKAVAPLFTQMKTIQKQSHTLATLRDTLLPKLLSGELSVARAL